MENVDILFDHMVCYGKRGNLEGDLEERKESVSAGKWLSRRSRPIYNW